MALEWSELAFGAGALEDEQSRKSYNGTNDANNDLGSKFPAGGGD